MSAGAGDSPNNNPLASTLCRWCCPRYRQRDQQQQDTEGGPGTSQGAPRAADESMELTTSALNLLRGKTRESSHRASNILEKLWQDVSSDNSSVTLDEVVTSIDTGINDQMPVEDESILGDPTLTVERAAEQELLDLYRRNVRLFRLAFSDMDNYFPTTYEILPVKDMNEMTNDMDDLGKLFGELKRTALSLTDIPDPSVDDSNIARMDPQNLRLLSGIGNQRLLVLYFVKHWHDHLFFLLKVYTHFYDQMKDSD